MSASPVVEARDLRRTYGAGQTAVQALDGVSLDIEGGRLTAIMGPSGSGKSTLMHVLAGLDRPDSGSVRYGHLEITELTDKQLTVVRRRRIGFIFQSFNLVPTLTVSENVLLPFALSGRKVPDEQRTWIDDRAGELGLRSLLNRRPHQLSGGQQQRVAILRALAMRPAVIYADEPTGNLDSRTGGEVLRLLQSAARDDGQAVVLVTHDAVAAAHADRVLFVQDGAIVRDVGRTAASTLSEMVLELTVAS